MDTGPAPDDRQSPVGGAQFALHCIGDVRLYRGASDCTPKSKKGRALLAIVAAEQRPLTRLKIIDLLWSDRQEEQARASLRTLLADLKAQFKSGFDDLLIVNRERIALGPGVRTDLAEPALTRPAGELFEGLDHVDPELDEWLRSEREKWARQAIRPSSNVAAPSASSRREFPRWTWAAALLLALALGALLYFRPWTDTAQPVVAVLKIKDLTGANALLSEGLAEDLRLGLAQNPRINVIGRVSSEDPSLTSFGTTAAASRLRASHFVEGSLRPLGREIQLNLRLIDTDSGQTIWTGAARASGAAVATGLPALASQMAELLTDVLSNRVPAHSLRADDQAYAAVFEARAAIAVGDSGAIAEHRGVLEEVVRAHPNFVPGLVALSRATMSASDHPFSRGPIPLQRARREAASYAQRAIRLAPSYAPAYDALAGAYREMDQALPLLRKTLSLIPGSAITHRRLAWELEGAGDLAVALEHWRAAARLDPLNLTSHIQLLRALDFSGDKAELRRVGAEYAARIYDPKTKWTFDAIRASYDNDWSRFVTSTVRAERIDPEDEYTHRLLANGLRLMYGTTSALPYAGEPGSYIALVLSKNVHGVVRKLENAGADFFRLNFETAEVADFLGVIGRRDLLVATYDRARRDRYPPEISDFGMAGGDLVLGLREAGRHAEASALVQALEDELGKLKGVRQEYIDLWRAPIDLLKGRQRLAVVRLARAYHRDWGLSLLNEGRAVYQWGFVESIKNHPEIVALDDRFEREMARERREATREMNASKLRPLRCRGIPGVCAS